MENNYSKSVKRFLWAMVIGHLMLISYGAFSKIMHWPYWEVIMLAGFLCFSICWLVIFFEIIRKDIYNRTFWLVSMFILPTVSPVVYMIRREKLIRYAEIDEQKLNLFNL
jgi:hypothetical protein